MWDQIFILVALISPLILLALAAGAAGPIIKIKVRLGLLAFVILASSMVVILRDAIRGDAKGKVKKDA